VQRTSCSPVLHTSCSPVQSTFSVIIPTGYKTLSGEFDFSLSLTFTRGLSALSRKTVSQNTAAATANRTASQPQLRPKMYRCDQRCGQQQLVIGRSDGCGRTHTSRPSPNQGRIKLFGAPRQ